MRVLNVHGRELAASAAAAGRLIDGLASADDALWPHEVWPPMRFDRPLGVGADGGHGPIRYDVLAYERGRRIVFRFKAPRGFAGTHRFDVESLPGGCRIVHTLSMDAHGAAVVSWPLLFRPLHDALVEDCMAKAQAALGETPTVVPWSLRVRALRRLLGRGRTRPQSALLAQPIRAPGR